MRIDMNQINAPFRDEASKIFSQVSNEFQCAAKNIYRQRDENVFQQRQSRYTQELKKQLTQLAEKLIEQPCRNKSGDILRRKFTHQIAYNVTGLVLKMKSM